MHRHKDGYRQKRLKIVRARNVGEHGSPGGGAVLELVGRLRQHPDRNNTGMGVRPIQAGTVVNSGGEDYHMDVSWTRLSWKA